MNLADLAEAGFLAARLESPSFDRASLREYYDVAVAEHPRMTPYSQYGISDYHGWSLLSATGDPSDGFQPAHVDKRIKIDSADFINPTPMLYGYAGKVVSELDALFGGVCRVRVMIAEPSFRMDWHVDYSPRTEGIWRAHIALKTEPNALLSWRAGDRTSDFHIPADGHLHFVRVDVEHHIDTRLTEERAHLMIDFVDPWIVTRDLDLIPEARMNG